MRYTNYRPILSALVENNFSLHKAYLQISGTKPEYANIAVMRFKKREKFRRLALHFLDSMDQSMLQPMQIINLEKLRLDLITREILYDEV